MSGVTYTIIHPTTGDRATAPDLEAAQVAKRQLRNDAVDNGCSPRIDAMIFHPTREGER